MPPIYIPKRLTYLFCIIYYLRFPLFLTLPVIQFSLQKVAINQFIYLFNVPTSTLLGDYGNDRSSKKLKTNFAAKYGLHQTLEHAWPIINGRHVHDVHVQRFQDSK